MGYDEQDAADLNHEEAVANVLSRLDGYDDLVGYEQEFHHKLLEMRKKNGRDIECRIYLRIVNECRKGLREYREAATDAVNAVRKDQEYQEIP
jgi:hypothetical protein